MADFPITRRLLELVRNAWQAYNTHNEVEKAEKERTQNRKRKVEEDKEKTRVSVDLTKVKEEIANEQSRLRAAQDILRNGQVKLQVALAANPLNKVELVAAKDLIGIGTEKVESIETMIKELEAKLIGIKKSEIKVLQAKLSAALKRRK